MRRYSSLLMRWLPVGILLLAAYWRFDALETQSFWHDEGNTLRLVQRDVSPLIEAVKPDIHPPGYYLVLKGWVAFMGETEFGLRSLSAFWGILTVVLTYALGKKLYESSTAGWLAALLVAVNAFQVYYSQEARMYAQLAALSTLSLWLLTLFITSRRKGRVMLALALVNTLGLYTQYTYPFTMLVQGIFFVGWLFLSPSILKTSGKTKRHTFLIYVLGNLLTVSLFAAWLPTAYDQITAWPNFDDGSSLTERISTIATYITYGNSAFNLNVLDYAMVGILVATLILPDYYKNPPSHGWRVGLPLVWLLVICGALVVSGAYREANLKFLLPAQVGVALLVGRGAYLLYDIGTFNPILPAQFAARLTAIVAFLAVFNSNLNWLADMKTRLQRDDYRGIAAAIESMENAPDAILLNAPNQYEVFTYYYDGKLPIYPLPRGYGGDDAATRAETEQIISNHPRIFVVFWGEGERDPNGIVRTTLDSGAYEISSRWYGDVRLVLYAVLEVPPSEPIHRINQKFGENITLKGYAISGDGIATAGSVIGVTLFWETDQPLDKLYKVTVQILNPDGTLAAQHDSEPANGRSPTSTWQPDQTIIDNHGVLVKPSLVSGAGYQIIVGMYELDHPENRLQVNNQESLLLEGLTIQ